MIVKAGNNEIFGGFTNTGFKSQNKFQFSANSFVFNLTKKKKYTCNNQNNSVYDCSSSKFFLF
jgi:hypothetical protein